MYYLRNVSLSTRKMHLNKLKYINYQQQQHNYQQHMPPTPISIRLLDGATIATDITEHLNKMSLFKVTKTLGQGTRDGL